MEIYVLDRDMNIIGIFSSYESILWNRKMYEPGKFKATFIFSEKMNRVLSRGNMLYKTDEDEPGIITRKYLKLNNRGQQTIQIQGYMASRYLKQRIVWSKTILKGTPEDAMRQLVYEQAVAPADSDRVLPNVHLGERRGYPGEIEKQVTYNNLQESLTDIAKSFELGYLLRADLVKRVLFFEVYQGVDRTIGSEHPCIFSRDFGNILTQEYYEDDSNFYNVCLTGGTGKDTDRKLVTVGSASGFDRNELFYNASGLSDKDLADEAYASQLRQKGAEKLKDFALVQSYENKINQRKAMQYALGDYVTCTDSIWQITINAQVTEIEKGYSKSEESCYVTLGNKALTLTDLIKAKE